MEARHVRGILHSLGLRKHINMLALQTHKGLGNSEDEVLGLWDWRVSGSW